jgi:ubiquinone/menaquinone biosynthesis C-methylase UbiE
MSNSPELPPSVQVLQTASAYVISACLGVAARLCLADLLAAGPRGAADLAAATSTNADAVYRTLRALTCAGIFTENEDGTFCNSELSETLRSDHPQSVRAMTAFLCDDMHWKCYAETLYSVQTGKPSFDHVYGMPPFQYMAQNPELAKSFDDAMASNSSRDADAVAAAFECAPGDLVADIGGGNGRFLSSLLRVHPEIQAVLFDLPYAIAHARTAGLVPEDRCRMVEGDFFQAVAPGATIYTMKHIIHDWSDPQAITLLQNCAKVMRPGNKLRIVELMMPPRNVPGFAKILDIEMLLLAGGRERTTDEYSALMSAAGLRLTRVIPTHSPLAIFEGELG